MNENHIILLSKRTFYDIYKEKIETVHHCLTHPPKCKGLCLKHTVFHLLSSLSSEIPLSADNWQVKGWGSGPG